MFHWVARQRKRYRQGILEAWKITWLKAIGFTFVGERLTTVPTNAEYARRLIAFHREFGHYAPTISYGGSGLTRWCRLMRDSGGRHGIISASNEGVNQAEDVAVANDLLRAALPNFSWENTSKVTLHESAGLTHNGYAPSGLPPWRPKYRMREVMERARASIVHPSRQEFQAVLPKPFAQLLLRSTQACRVRIFESTPEVIDSLVMRGQPLPKPLHTGYLHDVVVAGGGDMTSPQMLVHCDTPGQEAGPLLIRPQAAIRTVYTWNGEWHLQLMALEGGLVGIFDYDLYLDDQLEFVVPNKRPGFRPEGTYDPDWAAAMAGLFDGRLSSTETTANMAFPQGMRRVRNWLATKPALADRDVRLTNDGAGIFRFLEHQVLKLQQGVLPLSHSLRLRALDFTFGVNRKHSRDLFKLPPGNRLSEKTPEQIAAIQTRVEPKPRPMPTGSPLEVARAKILAFAERAKEQGKDVMVQGEEGAYYFCDAQLRHGQLEITYSNSRRAKRGSFGASLFADDLRHCQVSAATGLRGIDSDGESIRIFVR
jgi:hypothetical protein